MFFVFGQGVRSRHRLIGGTGAVRIDTSGDVSKRFAAARDRQPELLLAHAMCLGGQIGRPRGRERSGGERFRKKQRQKDIQTDVGTCT